MYSNLPIVDEHQPHPYRDTPSPRRFGSASPLDPGLFLGVDEFVQELTELQPSGRVSPVRVARTLDALATGARRALVRARAAVPDQRAPGFHRLEVDVAIQAGLGAFFAAKLRAGVAYSLWETTGNLGRLQQALQEYRAARTAWVSVVGHGRAYRDDVTVGGEAWLRGNWSDRLPAIDADLADMQAKYDAVADAAVAAPPPIDELDPPGPPLAFVHAPVERVSRGMPAVLSLEVEAHIAAIDVHYRHVNQAETYRVLALARTSDQCWTTTIPADYTDSPFPLQYYFIARAAANVWRIPDLAADLANQPYWLIRTGT
jgi:hypothetical protein